MQLHYIRRLDACRKALIRLKFTSQSQARGLVLGNDLLGRDLETQYPRRVQITSGPSSGETAGLNAFQHVKGTRL
jgi:hypothetical protein